MNRVISIAFCIIIIGCNNKGSSEFLSIGRGDNLEKSLLVLPKSLSKVDSITTNKLEPDINVERVGSEVKVLPDLPEGNTEAKNNTTEQLPSVVPSFLLPEGNKNVHLPEEELPKDDQIYLSSLNFEFNGDMEANEQNLELAFNDDIEHAENEANGKKSREEVLYEIERSIITYIQETSNNISNFNEIMDLGSINGRSIGTVGRMMDHLRTVNDLFLLSKSVDNFYKFFRYNKENIKSLLRAAYRVLQIDEYTYILSSSPLFDGLCSMLINSLKDMDDILRSFVQRNPDRSYRAEPYVVNDQFKKFSGNATKKELFIINRRIDRSIWIMIGLRVNIVTGMKYCNDYIDNKAYVSSVFSKLSDKNGVNYQASRAIVKNNESVKNLIRIIMNR
ncbi:hypothetical protein [Borrelia miyamotoi]|uniref:hypothetical protein n=1 Tax=Borrelia miyamotoi TaxID=47466 RepID=UPI00087AFCA6|nr:hypothetical protein [Borrelia miyamotoi]AOW96242.1 hypothetical protein AXH25_05020 [Borrelia miyamotoi]WAZ95624.1 hypothetical protein O5397_06400 [Borrelia miyamotoi]WAZ96997.1 hypothetical protein O5405_06900 [Borrelia miyamotoi]